MQNKILGKAKTKKTKSSEQEDRDFLLYNSQEDEQEVREYLGLTARNSRGMIDTSDDFNSY